jgi:hypothetical protein
VTVLSPVIDRLRSRFAIGLVCVTPIAANSGETIAGLQKRNLEYILGVRKRTDPIASRIIVEKRIGELLPWNWKSLRHKTAAA